MSHPKVTGYEDQAAQENELEHRAQVLAEREANELAQGAAPIAAPTSSPASTGAPASAAALEQAPLTEWLALLKTAHAAIQDAADAAPTPTTKVRTMNLETRCRLLIRDGLDGSQYDRGL